MTESKGKMVKIRCAEKLLVSYQVFNELEVNIPLQVFHQKLSRKTWHF